MSLFEDVSQETKDQTVKAIEQANSKEYQRQVAEFHLVNRVIEDMLKDPFWYQVITEALSASPAHDGQKE